MANVHNHLAGLYLDQGNYHLAERHCQRAAKILAPLGNIDPDIDRLQIQTLGNLGNIWRSQGRYQDAEAPLLQALSLAEEQLDTQDLDLAIILNSLGMVYKYLARFEEGEWVYHRALAIVENSHPTEQIFSGLTLS